MRRERENARDFEFVATKLTKGAFKFRKEKTVTPQWVGRIQLFAPLFAKFLDALMLNVVVSVGHMSHHVVDLAFRDSSHDEVRIV